MNPTGNAPPRRRPPAASVPLIFILLALYGGGPRARRGRTGRHRLSCRGQ